MTEPDHTHHYMLPSPNGDHIIQGICKHCGHVKDHYTSAYYDTLKIPSGKKPIQPSKPKGGDIVTRIN